MIHGCIFALNDLRTRRLYGAAHCRKFFNKTYRDPKFVSLKQQRFLLPGPDLLAKLDIPTYKEAFELDRKLFDLGSIFGKKAEEPKLRERPKSVEEPEPKEKPVWNAIKNIFRKKKK
jgi:hypothetical protein